MAVVGLVFIWVIVALVTFLIRRWHMIQLGYKIPGPKAYPVVGNALMFIGKPKGMIYIF